MDEPDPCQHEQIRMAMWRSFGGRIAGIDEWAGRNLSWAAEDSRARSSTFNPHSLPTSMLMEIQAKYSFHPCIHPTLIAGFGLRPCPAQNQVGNTREGRNGVDG